MKKTIAIDFDGVIHKYSRGWADGTIYDKPMEGAKTAMAQLVKKGFKVIIFTTRLSTRYSGKEEYIIIEEMFEWLEKYGFKQEIHFHDMTCEKPPAMVYIDDRAIRFTNWRDILNYF